MAEKNPLRYRGYYYDNETGFYYLQSRYYDPAVKRFINADIYTSTDSADAVSCNMFAYCGNNPVASADPSGEWSVKSVIKWFAKNVARPVVKGVEHVLSKLDFTFSRGLSASATPGIFSLNAQLGIAFDLKGNVAMQWNLSGGVTTGSPGLSLTSYHLATNAPEISDLEDTGYQLGGLKGIPIGYVPVAVGGDFNIIPNSKEENKYYYGISDNVGLGSSELHVIWGDTWTIKKTQHNVLVKTP